MLIDTHTHICLYIHMLIHTYAHTYICAYIHIPIHRATNMNNTIMNKAPCCVHDQQQRGAIATTEVFIKHILLESPQSSSCTLPECLLQVYSYSHIYIHTYIHTFIHVCVYIYIYIYICSCTYVRVYAHRYIYSIIYMLIHTYIHTFMY